MARPQWGEVAKTATRALPVEEGGVPVRFEFNPEGECLVTHAVGLALMIQQSKRVRNVAASICLLGAAVFFLAASVAAPAYPATVPPGVKAVSPILESTGWDERSLARERVLHLYDKSSSFVAADGSTVSVEHLRSYLESFGSPLAPYAQEIVLAGNRHGVRPSIIVAIAGVESSFGKHCAGFNAWGWDGGRFQWSSWTESIDDYARRLSANYPDWRNVRKNAAAYNPNTPDAWGSKVSYLVRQIETQVPKG